ncbi:MAG: TVP38/TMEM64 family protein [Gammaproteobacteria bacterium]
MHERAPRTPGGIRTRGMGLYRSSPLLGVAVLLALVVVVAVLVRTLDLESYVQSLAVWVEGLGMWGPLAFILIDAAIVVLLLPGVLVTFSGGFLFGLFWGTLYVVIGTTIGATVAFLVARWLAGSRARRFVSEHPRLKAVSNAYAGRAWQVVLLTRMIPFFPFKLSNYFFGLTAFRLRSFVAGTALGIVPFSFTNVYIGSFAANLSALDSALAPDTPLQWSLYVLGLVGAVAGLIFLSRLARLALSGRLEGEPSDR